MERVREERRGGGRDPCFGVTPPEIEILDKTLRPSVLHTAVLYRNG